MIVVDASVLATALADDGVDGDHARARLRGDFLAAPELVDLEVPSVLRRLLLAGRLPARRAEQALSDLVALPFSGRRTDHCCPNAGACERTSLSTTLPTSLWRST